MIKKCINILILIYIFLELFSTICLGYSDELFEFDLPNNYGNLSYKGIYAFASTDDSKRGFIIYTHEDSDIKKSVWDVSNNDFDRLISKFASTSNIISKDKKAKLGKEKALKATVKVDDEYMDIYILASNKYIYMVIFNGKTQDDLNNSEYDIIKKSFKLKDHTTNYRLIYIFIVIVAIAISMFLRFRRTGKIL